MGPRRGLGGRQPGGGRGRQLGHQHHRGVRQEGEEVRGVLIILLLLLLLLLDGVAGAGSGIGASTGLP